MVDLRGTTDALGRELLVTEVAVVDEIAGAAELVMGKSAGIPVAVVRGVDPSWFRTGSVADEIIRHPTEDLFRSWTGDHPWAGIAHPGPPPSGRAPSGRSGGRRSLYGRNRRQKPRPRGGGLLRVLRGQGGEGGQAVSGALGDDVGHGTDVLDAPGHLTRQGDPR